MLAFAPKTLPWAAPPPLVLALRESCLDLLLADRYFLDDARFGQSAFCMVIAPLAAARKGERFESVKQRLAEIERAGGAAAEDATNAWRSMHFAE